MMCWHERGSALSLMGRYRGPQPLLYPPIHLRLYLHFTSAPFVKGTTLFSQRLEELIMLETPDRRDEKS
jgi:hypothetical protein